MLSTLTFKELLKYSVLGIGTPTESAMRIRDTLSLSANTVSKEANGNRHLNSALYESSVLLLISVTGKRQVTPKVSTVCLTHSMKVLVESFGLGHCKYSVLYFDFPARAIE